MLSVASQPMQMSRVIIPKTEPRKSAHPPGSAWIVGQKKIADAEKCDVL